MEFPRVREAPAEVVRGLREVDPRTHVLWWGEAWERVDRPDPAAPWRWKPFYRSKPAWLVGVVDPLKVGNAIAGARVRLYDEAPLAPEKTEAPEDFAMRARTFRGRRRLAHLAYQGFVPKFYWYAGVVDGELVLEYEKMGWFARTLFETFRKQQMAELENLTGFTESEEARERLMVEMVQANMRSIWHHTLRGRKSFMMPAA
ncbi:MAG TPA: hypothetical protein VEU74_12080 [Gemmatimonadales bacterium]|nr:hypothetical protein [Gemmatimonadales bacterium]